MMASLVLVACGGGESAPTAEPPAVEAPETPPPSEAPAEIPTTPTEAVATSSVVSRPAVPATGCPAIDASAIALPGTVHSSGIQSNEVLDLAGSPHRFPEGVTVDAATVTVEPCALVLVGAGQSIFLRGGATLTAIGDATHPIRFDAIDAAATRGGWDGIHLEPEATPRSRLSYVTIEDAGSLGGYTEPGALWSAVPIEIHELTVRRSGSHGVSLRGTGAFTGQSSALHVIDSGNAATGAGLVAFADASAVGSLPDVTHESCDNPEIVIVGDQSSIVTTTQTWRVPAAGVRYHLRTDLTVEGPTGPILTLAPGTTLAFDASRTFFVGGSLDGGLVADGQADATRITLTSARSVPSPGDWSGIMFGDHTLAAASRLSWATIAFAGGESGWSNPHGCNQAGAAHFAVQMREHPIAAVEHLRVVSLVDDGAAIQRAFVSDAPPDYTAAALDNELASGHCPQSFVEPPGGCPDTVPPCGG